MDSEGTGEQGMENRVCEALKEAKGTQAHLNTAVTSVDSEEQLRELEVVGVDAAMYGTPVISKDNVNMKRIRTTASSRILDNYIPVYNTHIADKLQATGAIVIAKASMDEPDIGGTNRSAYTGPINNAWDESRISEGSSGGSAALIAAGVVPFAVGTDTGDSVRKPAAYQEIIGMKPAYGRISRYGITLYVFSLDHVDHFTISVQDTAVVLEMLAGRDGRDMTSSNRTVEACTANLNRDLRGKQIAVLDNVREAVVNPTIRENFDVLMKKLEARGVTVTHVCTDDRLMKALMSIYYIIANAETTANHSNLDGIRLGMREAGEDVEDVMTNTWTEGFCSYVRKRFVVGSYSLFVEDQDKIFRRAQEARHLIVEELDHILANSDVIIASAAGTIALLAEESRDSHLGADNNVVENHMMLGNFTGHPSVTMPTNSMEGMPIGINMMVKAFDGQILSNTGLAIEEETGLKGNDVKADT